VASGKAFVVMLGEAGRSQKSRVDRRISFCGDEGLLSSIRICREGNSRSKEQPESIGFYEE